MKFSQLQEQRGAIAIITILWVMVFSLAVLTTTSALSIGEIQMVGGEASGEKTFNAAEAGINRALYQLVIDAAPQQFDIKVPDDPDGVNVHVDITTYSSVPPQPEDRFRRLITSTATSPGTNSIRKLEVVVDTNSFAGGPNYAVQAGAGGVYLDNNSEIIGDVYSNGDIIPASGGAKGTVRKLNDTYLGHVWVAENHRIEKVDVLHGDAFGHTISSIPSLSIAGKAYYQSLIGTVKAAGGSDTCTENENGPNCFDNSPDPKTEDLYIIDGVHVQKWVDEINDPSNPNPPLPASNPADCPVAHNVNTFCVFNADVTIGRQKIGDELAPVDLYVGNGRTLTLTGNVYVTGNIIIDTNATIQVLRDGSNKSWSLISIGTINVENNAILQGSGHISSFLMIISRSTAVDLTGGSSAIYGSNNSSSVVFAAPNGMVKVKNNGYLRATVADSVFLEPRSQVEFNPNLSDLFVPPSGNLTFGILPGTWKEK